MFTTLWESLARVLSRVAVILLFSLACLFSTPIWIESIARANVIISEVMANPDSGGEWIEIANVGEESEAMNNFTLYDTLSSPTLLFTFPEPFLLEPQAVSVIEIPGTNLNNSGDTLVLNDTANNQVTSFSYTETTKGLSWNYNIANGLYLQTTPTPGAHFTQENAPLPSPVPSPSIQPSPESSPAQEIVSETVDSDTKPSTTKESTDRKSEVDTTEVQNTILSLLESYTARYTFLSTLPPKQEKDTSATLSAVSETNKPFLPENTMQIVPKRGIISVMFGGILISVASYCCIYVLETKKITA